MVMIYDLSTTIIISEGIESTGLHCRAWVLHLNAEHGKEEKRNERERKNSHTRKETKGIKGINN